MTHKKNHRDRQAIKAIKEREGCGHQAATRILAREREEQSRERSATTDSGPRA